MKNYTVILSLQANRDLRSIYEYIAYELESPKNASGQLKRLEDAILKLNVFPKKFRLYEKEPWHSLGLRIMVVDNYLIFYIPNDDIKTVNVLRVVYCGRDIDKHLNEYIKPLK